MLPSFLVPLVEGDIVLIRFMSFRTSEARSGIQYYRNGSTLSRGRLLDSRLRGNDTFFYYYDTIWRGFRGRNVIARE
jgi:hypothetical protein